MWPVVGLLLVVLAGALAAYQWKERRSRQAAGLHAVRATELRDKGDLGGAARELEQATRLDPRNGYAWYLLASTKEGQQRGLGLPAYARAAALMADDAALMRDYGLALHEAGRIEEARTRLRRAVQLNPTDHAAHAALGRAYIARITGPDDLKQGVEALRTALTLQPGDIQSRYRLARALHQSEELDAARSEFETTLSLLDEGAQAMPRMDGRTTETLTWISIVKGCHHHLVQIASRQKRRAERDRHQRLFEEMDRYIRAITGPFTQLSKAPGHPGAQRELKRVFRDFGFPEAGPDGRAAAARWIRG